MSAERVKRGRFARGLRKAVMYAIWLLLAAVAVMSFLEVSTRLLIHDAPGAFSLFVPTEEGLYRLRPGFDDDIPTVMAADEPKALIPAGISSQGLRDEEYGPKPAGEIRILMLGDSQTFGWALPPEQALPKQLEHSLETALPEQTVRVVNGGVPGYGPWQAHALLRDIEGWLQPDIVILQTFLANDLADTLTRLTPGLHVLETYRPYRPKLIWRWRHHERWPMALDNWFLSHSHVYHLLWSKGTVDTPFCRAAAWLPFAPDLVTPRLPPNSGRYLPFEADLTRWYPKQRMAWDMFLQDIAAIESYCRRRRMGFGVFNVPYPFDLKQTEMLDEYPSGFYTIDSAGTRLEEHFAREGYPHAALIKPFREAPDPASLVFQGNEHLTVKGAQLVVAEIRKQFLDRLLRQRVDQIE